MSEKEPKKTWMDEEAADRIEAHGKDDAFKKRAKDAAKKNVHDGKVSPKKDKK